MTRKEREWFIAERARVMARVHLTRRPDLGIIEAPAGLGLDYLVSIKKGPARPSVREFGVALRGTLTALPVEQLNESLHGTMQHLVQMAERPYPTCLFHFAMQNDQAHYTWLVEPVVTEEGGPRLRALREANCRMLDREALDGIVSRVDAWYDAFYASITAGAS